MQFCFYSGFNQMLGNDGLESTALWAEKNGFSSVEFLQLKTNNWHKGVESLSDAKQTRKVLQTHGLTTACYSVAANLLEGKPIENELKRHAELAAELHSPFLHHTLIDSLVLSPNSPSFDDVFEQILQSATNIAKYCERLGITCLYEEQGLYFNGIKNFGLFFKEMQKRCKNVGICGDFGNILFVDEAPERFFDVFKQDIKHVHLKDYAIARSIDTLPDKEAWLRTKHGAFLKDSPFGAGNINLQECFRQLRSANYQGTYSLEVVNPTENNAAAMKLAKLLL